MQSVSVIIPVKNDLTGARRILECMRKQSVSHELIVVDNGSTDGTREFFESQGVQVLHFPGLRVGALRNRGVEVSTGACLAFADSDHEVGQDWLERGLKVLESNPTVAACGSHYLPPPNGTWVQRIWGIHRLRNNKPQEVDWLASGNLFVRREKFLEIGGFNEILIAAEDVDLCHRLRQEGGRICLDPRIESIHHGEARNLRRFIRKEWWRGSSGLRAWFSQGFPLREIPSLVWPGWHLFFSGLFALYLLLVVWRLDYFHAAVNLFLILIAWVAPSILLALIVAKRAGIVSILQLAFLYFVYGTTRGWALFRL